MLYESNSTGGVALATSPSQTAAKLVDVAAGETGNARCVYSVSVTLTDSADATKVMRDPSADAPDNVDATSGSNSVTDTWVAAGSGGTPPAPGTALSEFTPGVTIAEIPNGHEGATFTFTYPINTAGSPATGCTGTGSAPDAT